VGNPEGASTPSSSFFQGLSVPVAPSSPGDEVQQQTPPDFLSLPEEDTVEHLLGAVPAGPAAPMPLAPAPEGPQLLLPHKITGTAMRLRLRGRKWKQP
jgi:hypothetical protein